MTLLLLLRNETEVHEGAAQFRLSTSLMAHRPADPTDPNAPVVVGTALTSMSLNILDEQGFDMIGSADVAVDLVQAGNGPVETGGLGEIQHQGAPTLQLSQSFTNDGRTLPVLQLPPRAQNGGGQMSFGVSVTSEDVGVSAGDPVPMLFGWRTAGQAGAQGQVIRHPDTLNVEFTAVPGRVVIVTVPPVEDWKTLRETNQTPQHGDPEFF